MAVEVPTYLVDVPSLRTSIICDEITSLFLLVVRSIVCMKELCIERCRDVAKNGSENIDGLL